ncbi:MAG TPA: cadherin repeat domain-containing protein, partial [Sphingomicrobium sp.]|nr:cadherin repeat domain-containing protein [Sphingomicrobium sp.]
PSGQISFVAAPDFEAPTDSDGNNSYVLVIQGTDANGNSATQTVTVTVLNVDELQRKLDEIGGSLRGDVRNQAFASLSTMLSFNEGLLGLDQGVCAEGGTRKPLSGGLNGDEHRQDANIKFRRDFSSCQARTRVLVDAGIGVSRVDRNWTTRGLGSVRIEQRIGRNAVLGAALLGTASRDELASFEHSRISDRSIQLNAFGRIQLSDDLRFAAFAGWGRAWYSFDLKDDGLALEGDANGKRYLYGAALSGDLTIAGFKLTTDAILSRAVERLGSASLDARYMGEDRKNVPFRLGRVDITRLSVPVHIPITFRTPDDGREAARLEISPGLLCQDTAQHSSALDCGYELGLKFRISPELRSSLRAEARTEAVDGYILNSFSIGFQRRFGHADRLSWGVELGRHARAQQGDNRVMVRLGFDR